MLISQKTPSKHVPLGNIKVKTHYKECMETYNVTINNKKTTTEMLTHLAIFLPPLHPFPPVKVFVGIK
jgi:hypothetical protein